MPVFFRNILLILALLFAYPAKCEVVISVLGPQVGEYQRQAYFEQILLRALELAKGEFSEAKIVHISHSEATRGGVMRLIQQGVIDVYWTATSREREDKMLPVRIPLMRGLLGYRVSIVHRDIAQTMRHPDTVMRNLTACQVRFWPDTEILLSNQFNVAAVNDFHKNFELTHKKRCDFFPRAIFEGLTDLAMAQATYPELTLFDDVLLYYPYPLYFFTAQQNRQLNVEIADGLELMVTFGELQQRLEKSEMTKHLFPLSQWRSKRIVHLQNPLLPEATPLDDTRLWIRL